MDLFLTRFPSPLGELLAAFDGEGRLRALEFADHAARLRRRLGEQYGSVALHEGPPTEASASLARKLARYFDGERDALQDVPAAPQGDALQEQVWAALRRLPAGQVTSYGELARALGHTDPRMARDIGAAIGANPVALVIPCHRVIGKDGSLKGFAWGLHRKRALLELEGHRVEQGLVASGSPEAMRLPGV